MGERLSAAERAHALPEILRRILLFLDNFSLCVALRTGSKLFASTVPILYRNIPFRVGLAIEHGVRSQSGRRGWGLTDIQPRERIYLGAIQVLDADHEYPERQQMADASLMPKGWYTGPRVNPCYFDPRVLDSFCVRFPNIRVIRKMTHPFSIAEAFTVDCQLKRIQHRKMIFLYPDDINLRIPILRHGRWKKRLLWSPRSSDPTKTTDRGSSTFCEKKRRLLASASAPFLPISAVCETFASLQAQYTLSFLMRYDRSPSTNGWTSSRQHPTFSIFDSSPT